MKEIRKLILTFQANKLIDSVGNEMILEDHYRLTIVSGNNHSLTIILTVNSIVYTTLFTNKGWLYRLSTQLVYYTVYNVLV